MNRGLLAIALAAVLAALAVSIYVDVHPVIAQDITVERDVQMVSWGPLAYTFPVFSWIGDAKGLGLEVIVFVLVLIVNRRSWIFAATAALTGGWYVLISHLILRPRPTTAQVIQVTEHPGASSYPSGHTMFVLTVMVVLMLCLGYRFLPRWAYPVGWAIVVAVVIANGIARIDTGAHWPTDVVGGLLISTAWLLLLLSITWVSSRLRTESE